MADHKPRGLTLKYVNREEGCGLFPKFHEGDAGYDLAVSEPLTQAAFSFKYMLSTGCHIELPEGYWAEVCGRSSNRALGIAVTRGIIDNGYRGELVISITPDSFFRFSGIAKGQRLAQLILHPIVEVKLIGLNDISSLSPSKRGTGGFGSTGI